MAQNMFRSGFLVRATHTLITWAVTLTLFLHNTGKSIWLKSQNVRDTGLLPGWGLTHIQRYNSK